MGDIEAGDVVRLNSGGPDMTVGAIEGKASRVYWANKHGGVDSALFNTVSLTKVRGADDVVISVSIDSEGIKESLQAITAMIDAEADKWAKAAEGKLANVFPPYGRRPFGIV